VLACSTTVARPMPQARQVRRREACEGRQPLFVARTGYTGEDGFEIVVPEDKAVAFWNALLAAGREAGGPRARATRCAWRRA
jgi:glycine cleavage system aminomethyltransferase T